MARRLERSSAALENKRIKNFEVLAKEAIAAEIDLRFLKFDGVEHKLPEGRHAELKEWLVIACRTIVMYPSATLAFGYLDVAAIS